jgi:hypothetical protein
MNTEIFTEFNLPRNAYAAFDALSIKQLMMNRIKASGIFPDIDYEGSNINGLIDPIAYSYHVLLFYLNQTASDSTFTQAELFENMNKIVSLIGYKTTGNNTAALNVDVTADKTLPGGNSYTIRRFSNVSIKNVPYSFNTDITFQKSLYNTEELIESIGSNNLLYQGIFKEYPLYTAIGENFEQFTLNIEYPLDVSSSKMVDHNNLYVFVKDINTQKWSEWKEISSLYLAESIGTVFEKRLNEYNHYEIKFGNNINGKRLNAGDLVSIFYLESDGDKGLVSSMDSKQGKLILYSSGLFNDIFDNIKDVNSNYLNANQITLLKFNNTYSSVPPTYTETVNQIRNNAPLIFSTQNRTVTTRDYESFTNKNFSNIIQSVKAVSNKDYTSEYLAYYYNLGLERPNLDDKLLFNQVSFNDACDFNNVYLFCVPRLGAIQDEITPIELFFNQKQSVVDKLNEYKMVNQNIVICDPIYLAFDFGLPLLGETVTPSIKDSTILRITRKPNEIISKDQIKGSVFLLIKEFFAQTNNELGQSLDFSDLSYSILSINGIKSIETIRKVGETEYKTPKLSFIYWNPFYTNADVNATAQNMNLKFFQFPFFYQISNLINKIEVI